jgi:hypothetical protein
MTLSRSRYIIAFLAALSTFPLFAQVNDTYVIPVIASAPGDKGTVWSTELNIFNPHAYELTVSAVYLPTLTGQSIEVLIDVPPNENFWFTSVLPEVFQRNGTGALLLATFPEDNPGVPDDIISRSFLVNSKTFNNAPTGTYGQLVPGTWTGLLDYEWDGISSIAHGIRNTGNFRTNIGAANLGNRTVRLLVSVYDDRGRTVANRIPFTLPFYGHLQERLPINIDRATVEFFLDDPSQDAVVFPYVSVVDNRSGDAVYMNPVLLADPRILFKHAMAGTELGRKIGTEDARKARSAAQRAGHGVVVKTADGHRLEMR